MLQVNQYFLSCCLCSLVLVMPQATRLLSGYTSLVVSHTSMMSFPGITKHSSQTPLGRGRERWWCRPPPEGLYFRLSCLWSAHWWFVSIAWQVSEKSYFSLLMLSKSNVKSTLTRFVVVVLSVFSWKKGQHCTVVGVGLWQGMLLEALPWVSLSFFLPLPLS